jgi:hypothetical protein
MAIARIFLRRTERKLCRFQNANASKAVHACHALCRARIIEEMQRRKGAATAEHLKFVLSVIDGPRLAADNSPGRSPA